MTAPRVFHRLPTAAFRVRDRAVERTWKRRYSARPDVWSGGHGLHPSEVSGSLHAERAVPALVVVVVEVGGQRVVHGGAGELAAVLAPAPAASSPPTASPAAAPAPAPRPPASTAGPRGASAGCCATQAPSPPLRAAASCARSTCCVPGRTSPAPPTAACAPAADRPSPTPSAAAAPPGPLSRPPAPACRTPRLVRTPHRSVSHVVSNS